MSQASEKKRMPISPRSFANIAGILFFFFLTTMEENEKEFFKQNYEFQPPITIEKNDEAKMKNRGQSRKEKKNRSIGLNVNRTRVKIEGKNVLLTLLEFKSTSNQFSFFKQRKKVD
jgi:hypothetical protein